VLEVTLTVAAVAVCTGILAFRPMSDVNIFVYSVESGITCVFIEHF
jgi:hypothetical protein